MRCQYNYEMDCPECDEGILQWVEFDEITVCDCCDHEINLNELCAKHWETCFVE